MGRRHPNPRRVMSPLGCAAALAVVLVVAPRTIRAQAAPPASAGPMVKDGLYVLQTGDEVAIRVFRLPELDETVRIRPDGRISVMLLDDIEAAGLTTRELDSRLTERYATMFKDPQVTLVVRQFANLKVYVGGEVGTPGAIALVGDLTATGAVFQAGGFRSTARLDSVVLLRNQGGDRPGVERLNMKEMLASRQPDVRLRPFDVVYVPLSRIARVDRFVDQHVRQLLPIALTGGFTYILGDRLLIR
jgi:polysaccharide export outer membrane protein